MKDNNAVNTNVFFKKTYPDAFTKIFLEKKPKTSINSSVANVSLQDTQSPDCEFLKLLLKGHLYV